MNSFKVSVIIPVYNAERFLRNAVESAVQLEEVGEVILVEDKSPDNALEICKQLVREYDKVKLYRHPYEENKGAGASRNLGIQKSNFEFIAFLDADDWYLPNRFIVEAKVLATDKDVDGVYGATGYFYHDKNLFTKDLTTISKKHISNNLLYNLTTNKGAFTTNAITLRRSLLNKTGLFDTDLKLHQDTHLWYRVAHFGNIVPGITDKPVAYRRVHSDNRIANRNRNSANLFALKNYSTFKNYKRVEAKPLFNIIIEYVRAKHSNIIMKYAMTMALSIYHFKKFKF
ncbi:glycosyltransferase family 2 protein [Pontibacter mangrovi]|uniref:Glycosyltransferase family 2 protein n=1 Tax=Pontibacter mangrovi TaxID=2589816 RepID=A0A501W2Y3_9BACT|nr:glycosyltransferase family 2 protein [Pontibacter mangrovi]TPE40006.1 glycosyltransferase family 2 protein [Pontibacter mangrovi]